MKRLLFILLASGIVITGAAQTLTQNYMKQIPALPRDSCNISRNSVEDFKSRVEALKEKLESLKDAAPAEEEEAKEDCGCEEECSCEEKTETCDGENCDNK